MADRFSIRSGLLDLTPDAPKEDLVEPVAPVAVPEGGDRFSARAAGLGDPAAVEIDTPADSPKEARRPPVETAPIQFGGFISGSALGTEAVAVGDIHAQRLREADAKVEAAVELQRQRDANAKARDDAAIADDKRQRAERKAAGLPTIEEENIEREKRGETPIFTELDRDDFGTEGLTDEELRIEQEERATAEKHEAIQQRLGPEHAARKEAARSTLDKGLNLSAEEDDVIRSMSPEEQRSVADTAIAKDFEEGNARWDDIRAKNPRLVVRDPVLIREGSRIKPDTNLGRVVEIERLRRGDSLVLQTLRDAAKGHVLKRGLDPEFYASTATSEIKKLDPNKHGPLVLTEKEYVEYFTGLAEQYAERKPLYDLAGRLARLGSFTPIPLDDMAIIDDMSDDDFQLLGSFLWEQEKELHAGETGYFESLYKRLGRSAGNLTGSVIQLGTLMVGSAALQRRLDRGQILRAIERSGDLAKTGNAFLDESLNASEMIVPILASLATRGLTKIGASVAPTGAVWYTLATNEIYTQMRDAGIDDIIAKPMALLAGIPHAMIEIISIRQLLPARFTKPLAKRAVASSMMGAITRVFREGVKTVGKEVIQEVTQDGLSAATRIGGGFVQEATIGGDAPKIDLEKELSKLIETGWATLKMVPFLMAGGQVVGLGLDIRDVKRQQEAIVGVAARALEADASAEQIAIIEKTITETGGKAAGGAFRKAIDRIRGEAVTEDAKPTEAPVSPEAEKAAVAPPEAEIVEPAPVERPEPVVAEKPEPTKEPVEEKPAEPAEEPGIAPVAPAEAPVEAVEGKEEPKHKVGDSVKVMNIDAIVAKTETIDGVTYELYNASKLRDKRGAIRVFDVESGETVTGIAFPTFDQAEAKYLDAVAKAKKATEPAKPVPKKPVAKPTVSIKLSKTEETLAEIGVKPIPTSPARPHKKITAEAQKRITDDATEPERLIQQLRTAPRGMTDTDVAVLQVHRRTLENARDSAINRGVEARKKGNDLEAQEALREAQDRENDIVELAEASKSGGENVGRALSAFRIELASDFSVAGIARRMQISNGLNPLASEQLVTIKEQADKIAELEQKLTERTERVDDIKAKRDAGKLIRDIKGVTPKKRGRLISQKVVDKARRSWNAFARGEKPTTGLNIDLLKDAAILAIDKIDQGVRNLADVIKALIAEFGMKGAQAEGFRKHLTAAWKRQNVQAALKAVEEAPMSSVEAAGGIAAAVGAGKSIFDMRKEIRQLVESLVAEGVVTRGKMLAEVHKVLQGVDSSITKRDSLHAISGYGRFTVLNKDEIPTIARDLTSQLLQVAKLQDMQEGRAPSITGRQRDKPSDKERRLIQRVFEAKRRGGFSVVDPETQLKSALETIKTRLRNQIADLEFEIETGRRIIKNKTEPLSDAEIEKLKKRKAVLQEQIVAIFGKKILTDDQRRSLAAKAIERSITELERRIREGDLFSTKKKTLTSPELEAVRARRDALKADLKELQDLADLEDPSRTEALDNQRFATRTANRIADLKEKIANEDFEPNPKKQPLKLTPDNQSLQFDLAKLKTDVERGVFKLALKNRTVVQKAFDLVPELSGITKSYLTSFDVSALGRQGFFAVIAGRVKLGRVTPEMLRAMGSEAQRFRVDQSIENRAGAWLYKPAGLGITTREAGRDKMEDVYSSRLVGKIPNIPVIKQLAQGVAVSERAFSTALNLIRADYFDALIAGMGGDVTIEEAKAIANFVNVWTGRGNISQGRLAKVIQNLPFFSARLLASRFQIIFGQPLWRGTWRTRKIIATEYLRTAVGMATLLGIIKLGIQFMWDDDDEDRPTMETNPLSSDFLKLKIGEVRIDLMAGLSQTVVFLSRMVTSHTKSLTGAIKPLSGDLPYGQRNILDVAVTFFRNKLNPLAGAVVDWRVGEDFKGDVVTVGSTLKRFMLPMSIDDTIDASRELGIPKGMAIGVLATLGISIQTHLKQGKSGFQFEMASLKFKQKKAEELGKPLRAKDAKRLAVMRAEKNAINTLNAAIRLIELEPENETKIKRQDILQKEIDAIYERVMTPDQK